MFARLKAAGETAERKKCPFLCSAPVMIEVSEKIAIVGKRIWV
jgi:hypothetical protein